MNAENIEKTIVPIYNIQERAFNYSIKIVALIGETAFDKIYFSIFDQLIRSATSIGANLFESSAGSSARDFIKFQTIALKSANETKYWLRLIKDSRLAEIERIETLLLEVEEISKIVAKIIINTKKRNGVDN